MRRPSQDLTDEERHAAFEQAMARARSRTFRRFGPPPRVTKHAPGATKSTVATRKVKNRARRKARKRSR